MHRHFQSFSRQLHPLLKLRSCGGSSYIHLHAIQQGVHSQPVALQGWRHLCCLHIWHGVCFLDCVSRGYSSLQAFSKGHEAWPLVLQGDCPSLISLGNTSPDLAACSCLEAPMNSVLVLAGWQQLTKQAIHWYSRVHKGCADCIDCAGQGRAMVLKHLLNKMTSKALISPFILPDMMLLTGLYNVRTAAATTTFLQ